MQLYEKTLAGIGGLDEKAMKDCLQRQDQLVKPLGSLGSLEDMSVKLAGITGRLHSTFPKKAMVIMAADNGVYAEGVASAPQSITFAQTRNFTKGITGICVLARLAKADLHIVDIGIDSSESIPGVIDRKIRRGSGNMAKGPAMSREEAVRAVEVGIEAVAELAAKGYSLLGTGEMGIGNTSTSSAVLMGLTGCDADLAVGKGAGLSEEGLSRKKAVIRRALDLNQPDSSDPLDVLSKVGGFDIAGLTGAFLGAAYYRIPIVIDGFISALAALVAFRLKPLAASFMFASHSSEEPGFKLIMKELGLEAVLNLHMRLGEGTGCPLAFNLIEAAEAIVGEMGSFSDAQIDGSALVDIRKP